MKFNKLSIPVLLFIGLLTILGCNLTNSSSDDTAKRAEDAGKTADAADGGANGSKAEEKNEVQETQTSTTVQFEKGATSRSYKNAVIRGETHTYTLRAEKGQKISVNIKSTEDNAVFRVQTPTGAYLGKTDKEAGYEDYDNILPTSGNYKIIVSPTRGNADFTINFAVKSDSAGAEDDDTGGAGGLTKTVKFKKGASSANYDGAVIRGDRDTYVLGAKGGQTMTVSISALEDNAVFQIRAPNGKFLAGAADGDDAKNWSGPLPSDGKYRIIVGGTRGNATYKINFSIR